jgi:DNA-binding response OmpR family regulator
MRLLLVEDHDRLSENLVNALRSAGFSPDRVADAAGALAALDSVHYAACILDLGLPDADGMSVLAYIRKRHDNLPVLICTARDAFEDRIAGLNAGSDDYLVKPFNMDELIARIRALLRRPGGALGVDLAVGNLVFDTVNRQASVEQEPLSHSRREIDLM